MRSFMRFAICLVLAVFVSACGEKATDPTDDILQNGCFAVPNNVGNIRATVSGAPNYSGIVQSGGAFVGAGAGSTPGVVTVGALDLNDGSQVIITGPARLGTFTANLTDPAAGMVSISFITGKQDCTGPTGNWIASAVQGSATFTLTTLSSTTVTGSFNGTMIPGGSGAVGNKTISGTFTASL
jgi:hypothetical protein